MSKMAPCDVASNVYPALAGGEHRVAARELTELIEGSEGDADADGDGGGGGGSGAGVGVPAVPGGSSDVLAALLRASCWHALGVGPVRYICPSYISSLPIKNPIVDPPI